MLGKALCGGDVVVVAEQAKRSLPAPDYTFGPIDIHVGDSREILPAYPEGHFDLVCTDPPWQISKRGNERHLKGKDGRKARTISFDFGEWDHFPSEGAFIKFTKQWLDEAYRVLSPQGTLFSFFAKEKMLYLWKRWERLGGTPRDIVVWHKLNPLPQKTKRGFQSATELAFWGSKQAEGHLYNRELGLRHNVFASGLALGNEHTVHPTQKSRAMLQQLLPYLTVPGSCVVDPFGGSGATGAACFVLDLPCVLIEKQRFYVEECIVPTLATLAKQPRLPLWEAARGN